MCKKNDRIIICKSGVKNILSVPANLEPLKQDWERQILKICSLMGPRDLG